MRKVDGLRAHEYLVFLIRFLGNLEYSDYLEVNEFLRIMELACISEAGTPNIRLSVGRLLDSLMCFQAILKCLEKTKDFESIILKRKDFLTVSGWEKIRGYVQKNYKHNLKFEKLIKSKKLD